MSGNPLDPDMAMRDPRGGRAHRGVSARALNGRNYVAVHCGLHLVTVQRLREVVPVSRTAPEDRCKRCFPAPRGEQ